MCTTYKDQNDRFATRDQIDKQNKESSMITRRAMRRVRLWAAYSARQKLGSSGSARDARGPEPETPSVRVYSRSEW